MFQKRTNYDSQARLAYFSKLKLVVNNWRKDTAEINSLNIVNSNTKRLLDLLISSTCLIFVASWLFPIIALLIKLTSKGPVFFKQPRIGYDGDVFGCYKFRTMYVEKVMPKFKPTTAKDPRITPIGVFLRKSNLDELPQIINVLLGEMTIVGPRPHAIPFHEAYKKFIPYIDKRLLVKPGITGLAQIKGFRGDVIDIEENKRRTFTRVAYDILYIKKWSLGFDFYIIYITAMQMLFRKTNGH